ncbi:GntR family transcriptional regulator [Paenochrobactrum pullorum]|uniref:GntR family transcriptional regulator n=1 Tax=Paenochrobactrum pullorum TaxID=1324351 RepID=UPI0035BBED77
MTTDISDKTTKTASAPKRRRKDPVVSLREVAYQAIKHRIITCNLKPGEVLSEGLLSDELNIGRTPVHQAIDRLASEGLIDVIPRKGIMVTPISLHEIFDIIDVRLINEAYCVRQVAKLADAPDIKKLETNLNDMWKAAKSRNIEAMMNLDREFHGLLSATSRNTILPDIMGNLHDRSTRLWFISLRSNEHHVRVCEQHAAVIEGIKAHDEDAAEQAIRDHIEAFRENITRQF